MSPARSLIHSSLQQLTSARHARFLIERKRLKELQEERLALLLRFASETQWGKRVGMSPNWNYATLTKKIPVTSWLDWQHWVELERKGEPQTLCHELVRFHPTSGSTQKRKWVPYNRQFLSELDEATLVWIHALYNEYPQIRQGRHYWSLSWLPNELRGQKSNSDLSYFPWFKQKLLSQIMAVPEKVQDATSAELSREQTLWYLALCEDLSFISVWSPTFLLNFVQELWVRREEFTKIMSARRRELCLASPSLTEFLRALWPRLALISSWDTADAARWAKEVRDAFHLPLQGKGLFATEGVVTIPIAGRTHLAYRSHFYEFKRFDQSVIPAWELKPGEQVQVLLSTGNGIWRYQLGDILYVEEIYEGCPILRFVGREQTVDLVGEKMSFQAVRSILDTLGAQALFCFAYPTEQGGQGRYELLWQGAISTELTERAEQLFLEHHHYRLARELGQLAPLKVSTCTDPSELMKRVADHLGWVAGDAKWDALIKLNNRAPLEQVCCR